MKETRTILLIEDQDDVAKAVRVGLEASQSYGFDVTRLSSLEDYAERAAASPQFRQGFDLYLVDLALSGSAKAFTGLRIIKARAFETPGAPIWVYTGHPQIQNVVRAMQLGATDFVSKTDCPPHELALRIARYFDEQHARSARLAEVDRLSAEHGSEWQREYSGQTIVLVSGQIVLSAPNQMAAWLHYDEQRNTHIDWPEEPDMIDIMDEGRDS